MMKFLNLNLKVNQCRILEKMSRQMHSEFPDIAEEEFLTKRTRSRHPFRQLYRWESLTQFVDLLEKNIIYFDDELIAINKPFGVGFHATHITTTPHRKHQLFNKFGDPKFCIDDALPNLSKRLDVDLLKCIKTIDRFASGVILLSANPSIRDGVLKSIAVSKATKEPYMVCHCIAQGIPNLKGPFTKERIGVKLVDLDGTNKDTEIVPKVTRSAIVKNRMTSVVAQVRTLETNTKDGCSLMEICSSTNRYEFIKCYAASKTSFILGDIRFGSRIRKILGVPIRVSALNAYDDFDPLNENIKKILNVKNNADVPLMLHHSEIRLPRFISKKQELVIKANHPHHFSWTLKQLKLA